MVGVAMALTLPELAAEEVPALRHLGEAAAPILTIEYALRLWIAAEAAPMVAARRRYALSAMGLIDLLSTAPFWIELTLAIDGAWLALAGLIPALKIGRYATGPELMTAVLWNERRALIAAFVTMILLLLFASGLIYVAEHAAQPKMFSSIPASLWWGIVTIASVGYGDLVPVTALGKIVGGIVIVFGISIFAAPIGIIATGFASELRRRDFIVTWQAVARLPLFAGLDVSRIAEIARLLRTEIVPENTTIVRRGEAAHGMYFIMDGEVEVELRPAPVRLGPGQYFGEIALIKDTTRTATVSSHSECRLPSLGVADFRRMIEAHPDLKAQIERVAQQRCAP